MIYLQTNNMVVNTIIQPKIMATNQSIEEQKTPVMRSATSPGSPLSSTDDVVSNVTKGRLPSNPTEVKPTPVITEAGKLNALTEIDQVKDFAAKVAILGFCAKHGLTKFKFCLNEIVPAGIQNIIRTSNRFISKLASLPIASLPDPVRGHAYTIITSPIVEEIEHRFLLQEVLLRRLPKMILDKCAPKYTSLIESRAAKIGRVALSTLVFGLCHITRDQDHADKCLGSNYGISVLGGGILLGYLTEKSGNIGGAIIAHMAHNFWATVHSFNYFK